jgi:mRNA-degrading endonuclease toxin of MazEF toxin-antitoxin module
VKAPALGENKRFLVVSNNVRNRKLGDVLACRLTTADKPDIPSIVEFPPGTITDSRSCIVADDIVPIHKEDLVQMIGALSPIQMTKVEDALRAALDL